jgi:hypothetical protein
LQAAPLHIAARRLARPEGWLYQWPGFYAETDFEGDTAWLQGPGRVMLRLWVDGVALPDTVANAGPSPAARPDPGAAPAARWKCWANTATAPAVRRPVAAGHGRLGRRRTRQIECIGDSHTVGYGNTANQLVCSDEQVWRHTDPTQAGARLAAHYDADYRLTAISGRGVVRNHDGHAAPTLPEVWDLGVTDPASPRDEPGLAAPGAGGGAGHQRLLHALRPSEPWLSRVALQADFRQRYAALLAAARAPPAGAAGGVGQRAFRRRDPDPGAGGRAATPGGRRPARALPCPSAAWP